MNTETREIRPFSAFKELDRLVHGLHLQVGERTIGNGNRLVLDEEEYRRLPVKVTLPDVDRLKQHIKAIENELASRELTIGDVVLSVNLSSSFLKISEFTHVVPLVDLPGQGDELLLTPDGQRPNALRTSRSGCGIEVAALLSRQKVAEIGRPWRKGTWLSRATFTLACEAEFGGFVPRPMDASTKADLRLPAGATRYIVVPPGVDPLVDEVTPDVVEMWVDADLLANLSARDKSPSSVAFQKQLFVDAFTGVMFEVRARSDFAERTWTDVVDSMFGKMIAAIAGRTSTDNDEKFNQRCADLMNLLKDDLARFVAHVESFADLTPSVLKNLGD